MMDIDADLSVARFAMELISRPSTLSKIEIRGESHYVSVANVLFSFYNLLYDDAVDKSSQLQIQDDFYKAYCQVFEGQPYISPKDALNIFKYRQCKDFNSTYFRERLCDLMQSAKCFPDSVRTYVYRRVLHMIIVCGKYMSEPYTSYVQEILLEQKMSEINNSDNIPSFLE